MYYRGKIFVPLRHYFLASCIFLLHLRPMNDEALAKVMSALEEQIGSERLSALRREAAKRGVTVLSLLGDAVVQFSEALANPVPQHASA